MSRSTAPATLCVISLLVLQACSTTPTANARLDEARRTYAAAQANPQVRDGAVVELKRAADALAQADAAAAARDDTARIDHLSYLALQNVVLAQQTGERKAAEGDVARANLERDQLRLAARTREAERPRAMPSWPRHRRNLPSARPAHRRCSPRPRSAKRWSHSNKPVRPISAAPCSKRSCAT